VPCGWLSRASATGHFSLVTLVVSRGRRRGLPGQGSAPRSGDAVGTLEAGGAAAVRCAAGSPAYFRHAWCLRGLGAWCDGSVCFVLTLGAMVFGSGEHRFFRKPLAQPPRGGKRNVRPKGRLAERAVHVTGGGGVKWRHRARKSSCRKLLPMHRQGYPPSETSGGVWRVCRSPGRRAAILLGKHRSPRVVAAGFCQRRRAGRSL
jgi:hypothetical protein